MTRASLKPDTIRYTLYGIERRLGLAIAIGEYPTRAEAEATAAEMADATRHLGVDYGLSGYFIEEEEQCPE